MNKLTLQDFCEAAQELGCSVAAIKAVATVESGGRSGFDDQDRLLIRFEGHQFRKFTGGRFDKSHPHLSYSYNNRFGKKHGYSVFNEAFKLDPHATLLATSFGMFQQMGFNFEEMGFDSVEQMVSAFQLGEKQQLNAFVVLIKEWGLADELQRATLLDFQFFAKRYNGADYKSNAYDTKMHDYYLTFKKQNLKCPTNTFSDLQEDEIELDIPKVDSANARDAVNPADTISSSVGRDQTDPNNPVANSASNPPSTSGQDPNPSNFSFDTLNEYGAKTQNTLNTVQGTFDSAAGAYSKVSSSSVFALIWKHILAIAAFVIGFFENNWEWILVGLIILLIAAWLWNQAKNRANERTTTALKK